MRFVAAMRAAACAAVMGSALFFADFAGADETKTEAPEVAQAREEFVKGSDRAKRAQWAEALQAFELSAKLRPHPVTTFNIGVCQRAMGNYTLARDTLLRALEQNQKGGGSELAESLVAEDKAFVAEIDKLLATVNVVLEPATATIAVDGRPLAKRDEDGEAVMVAGVRAPGQGEAAPSGHFRVRLNPGTHVFTLMRTGFADAVVSRTVTPGATTELRLELDRLPALLHISANQDGAVVVVNDVDVGTAPIDLSRPAGNYRVVLRKPGYKRYQTDISVRPGQELSLSAVLAKDETPLTQKWWFWTAAGVVVVGAAAGTYALTRGESTVQEPLNGGGLGWTAKVR